MNSVSKMVVVRLITICIAVILCIGFLPVEEKSEKTTLLSKYIGFLRPQNAVALETDIAQQENAVVENSENEKQKTALSMYDFSDKTEGKENAPVKMYLFSSLTCVHCAHFYQKNVPLIREKYVKTGKVHLIYKDFPLESRAMAASLVAHCLKKDRYEPFVASLYANQSKWMMSHNLQKALEPYARMAGLSKEKMKKCALNPEGLKKLNVIRTDNIKKYHIEATPMLILQTAQRQERITGVPEQKVLEEKIDNMLKEVGVESKENKKVAINEAP